MKNVQYKEKCDFTYAHYIDTLNEFLRNGYVFKMMSEHNRINDHQRVIFLRHDVDLSIEAARKIFKIEERLNIKSTYFLRLRKYNLLKEDAHEFIASLVKSNFEIGFHYDEEFSHKVGEAPHTIFKKEVAIFETIIGKEIYGISRHRPSTTETCLTDDFFKTLNIHYNAYNDFFLKDCKYISDSAKNWREGCMCQWIKKADRLCILIHPIWWFGKSLMENLEIIDS